MDDQLYDAHDQLNDTFWWFVGRRKVIREVLKKHLPPAGNPRRILDLGCGTGGNLSTLREFGEVTGLDTSERAVEAARLRGGEGVRVFCGLFPGAIPSEERFDLIGAFDVIEHLDDPVSLLRATRERLTPDGRLIVTVPAFPFLWSIHDDLNHHRRRYLRSTLLEHLSQGGFTADWVSYFNSALFPAIAAVRVVRKLTRLRESQSDAVAPAKPINALLTRLFSVEGDVVPHVSLPFGVSLIAIARAA